MTSTSQKRLQTTASMNDLEYRRVLHGGTFVVYCEQLARFAELTENACLDT